MKLKKENCSWCNKPLTEEKIIEYTLLHKHNRGAFKICSEDCKNLTEKFNKYSDANSRLFLIMIGMVVLSYVLLTILAVILKNSVLIAIAIGMPTLLLGATLYKYPFATPETIGYWGFRKSIKVGKISGIIIMIAGITTLLIAGFLLF